MRASIRKLGGWLRRRAENVAAAMLAVMFVTFIIQVVFRYVLNFPVGWTSEVTVISWLWLVLWGAAFVLKEHEEIRFDLIYGAVGRRTRRVLAIIGSIALLILYILSLPAAIDYVTFMKVQSTAYMKIRFDYLFSIYVIFAVAIIIRYLWLLWSAIMGLGSDESDASGSSPGR